MFALEVRTNWERIYIKPLVMSVARGFLITKIQNKRGKRKNGRSEQNGLVGLCR